MGVKTQFVGWCHVPLTRMGRRARMRARAKEREGGADLGEQEAERAERRKVIKSKSRLYTSGSKDNVNRHSSYDSVTSHGTVHDSDSEEDDELDEPSRRGTGASPWDVLAWCVGGA